MRLIKHVGGSTLLEMVIAITLASLLITSLARVVSLALNSSETSKARNQIAREARFAFDRIAKNVRATRRLMVPREDDLNTPQNEAWYEPGVLAFTLDPTLDRNLDGIVDADNDGDGRVDEDPSGDVTNDLATGIIGIDDDNDGNVDEPHGGAGPDEDDDDEDGIANEDGWDGDDDDDDGTTDEDPKKDMNGDGAAGIIGFDDDGDGLVDEGDKNDDDEDGLVNEDWFDVVAYFVSGTKLIERFPDLNPLDGTQFTERVLADGVSRFRVELLNRGNNRIDLVNIVLELTVDGEVVEVEQSIRVGVD